MTDVKERFMEKVIPEPNSGCWLWSAGEKIKGGGYGAFGYKGKVARAHRVSYELFCAEIPIGLFVLHKCDNPCCVNPDHLFLGTHQDNMDDRERKNRNKLPFQDGEKNHQAKLTEDDVRKIRSMSEMRHEDIAKIFNVQRRQISRIIERKRWAHVK